MSSAFVLSLIVTVPFRVVVLLAVRFPPIVVCASVVFPSTLRFPPTDVLFRFDCPPTVRSFVMVLIVPSNVVFPLNVDAPPTVRFLPSAIVKSPSTFCVPLKGLPQKVCVSASLDATSLLPPLPPLTIVLPSLDVVLVVFIDTDVTYPYLFLGILGLFLTLNSI